MKYNYKPVHKQRIFIFF